MKSIVKLWFTSDHKMGSVLVLNTEGQVCDCVCLLCS